MRFFFFFLLRKESKSKIIHLKRRYIISCISLICEDGTSFPCEVQVRVTNSALLNISLTSDITWLYSGFEERLSLRKTPLIE